MQKRNSLAPSILIRITYVYVSLISGLRSLHGKRVTNGKRKLNNSKLYSYIRLVWRLVWNCSYYFVLD